MKKQAKVKGPRTKTPRPAKPAGLTKAVKLVAAMEKKIAAARASGPAREAELVRQTLAAMAAIPDDPPGTDQAVMRAIDEERPERPLFKGLY